MFSAILIGLTAGLAAVLVKSFVHFFLHNIGVLSQGQQVYAALGPLIGIALTVFYIRYLARGPWRSDEDASVLAMLYRFDKCLHECTKANPSAVLKGFLFYR